MSSNGSSNKPGDGGIQQQNYKSSSLPGSPRMPGSPVNSSSSNNSGGGIKVKIKRTSSTDSRHTANNSNGNKGNGFSNFNKKLNTHASKVQNSHQLKYK